MKDPFRQMQQAEHKMNRAVNSPQRQMRQAQSRWRRVANAPGRQMQQAKSRARRLQQAPRRMKNQAMRPVNQMKRQAGRVGGSGRQYKRRADRMAPTDFSVSAMLYPFGFFLTPIAGMFSDWDTAYIRYHLVHARMLSFIAFLFVPLTVFLLLISPPLALMGFVPLFILWGYAWFLGFRAYGGNFVFVPFLTPYAERSGMIDFQVLEQIQQQMYGPPMPPDQQMAPGQVPPGQMPPPPPPPPPGGHR